MEKLGIYGDSWVDLAYIDESSDIKAWPKEHCWSYHPILRNKYDITIHATRGLDFYSTYQLFKKTHTNFDKIIFVVTDSLRCSVELYGNTFLLTPINAGLDFDNNRNRARSTIVDAENLKEIEQVLESIKNYLLYVNRDELLDAGVARLVDEIKVIRPDVELFTAFHNKFLPGFKLMDLARYEALTMGIDHDLHDYLDIRHAHMTRENNEIFANIVSRRLEGEKIELSLDMFYRPHANEKNKYFIPINKGT